MRLAHIRNYLWHCRIYLAIPFIEILNGISHVEKIHEKSAFGDDETSIVIIEFWAKFNDVNAFQEFKQLKNVTHYYRCDISINPELKKKYRVRMAPTILIFVNGVLEEDFRAGLDLECPVDLPELQEAIEEARLSSQF